MCFLGAFTTGWYAVLMTDNVKEAIEVLRTLPKDDQDTVAAAIMDFAAHDQHHTLSDAQAAEVRHRLAKPDRKLVSLSAARKRLRHFGA